MSDFRDLTDEEDALMGLGVVDSVLFSRCLCGSETNTHDLAGFWTIDYEAENRCPACGREYRLVIQVKEPTA